MIGALNLSLRIGAAVGAAFAVATLLLAGSPSSWIAALARVGAGAWLGALSGAALWFGLSFSDARRRTMAPTVLSAGRLAASLIAFWTALNILPGLMPARRIGSGPAMAEFAAAIGAALLMLAFWRLLAYLFEAAPGAPPAGAAFLLAFAAALMVNVRFLQRAGTMRWLYGLGSCIALLAVLRFASRAEARSREWRVRHVSRLQGRGPLVWTLFGAAALVAITVDPTIRREERAKDRRAAQGAAANALATKPRLGEQVLLTLGSEVRAVVAAPCPTDLTYPVEGAGQAELAWGVSGPQGGATAQFTAVVRRPGGGEEVLVDESVTAPAEGATAWSSKIVALPAGTESGDLVLRTRGTNHQSFWTVPALSGRRPGAAAGRSVIVVSLDTVRADHLNAYGYERRPTSPEIEAWAKEGTLFENANSTAPGTLSSQMSILTGRYPSSHGVSYANWRQNGKIPALARDIPTFPEVLRSHGFVTAAFTGAGYFALPLGFSRGFQEFVSTNEARGGIGTVFEKAFSWLERHQSDDFFMFLHSYEAHAPYLDQRFVYAEGLGPQDEPARNEALYDGDIRCVDTYVGALRRKIQALGLADRTLVLIVSDHGEEFSGHFGIWDDGHGHSLFQEVTRVPFVAVGPAVRRGQRIRNPVDLTAVAPTVLEFLRVQAPEGMRGRRLMGVLRGEAAPREPDWLAFSEDVWIGPAMRAVRSEGWTLIRRGEDLPERFLTDERRLAIRGKGREFDPEMLFDLSQDPGEKTNLSSTRKDRASQLGQQLTERLAATSRSATGGEVEVEGDARERLRALGYVQ